MQEFKVPGKWILAGEHAVLRGSPALVFPLNQRSLTLRYFESEKNLELDLSGEYGPEFRVLFWSVIDRACELSGHQKKTLKGRVQISSQIPIGSGLGASAALCVAVGKWFQSLGYIQTEQIYDFSRQLENLFHGESSGVDIAVALSSAPIRFLRNGDRRKIEADWKPRWYLSYSGKKGSTFECVSQVKSLFETDSQRALKIDEDMRKAVSLAEIALEKSEDEGLPLLVEAIDLGKKCFDEWGLSIQEPLDFLKRSGAVAVKPTGSGGGGYILSLWKTEPPESLKNQLISCE